MNDFPSELLLLVIPLVVVEVGLMVFGLWDLTRPGRRVRGDSRLVWALIIVFVNVLGPIIYFAVGREEREAETTSDAAGAPAGPPAPGAIAGWARPGGASAGPGAAAGPGVAAGPTSMPSPGSPGPDMPQPRPAAPTSPPAPAPSPPPGPRADAEPAILIRGLTKRYGGEAGVLALDRLDLDVPAGSVFGLLGPNGAGKTTTLRMLAGLAHPSGGTAIVAGTPIDGGGRALTRQIGYLDQDPRYYGWATGSEIVMLVGLLHGMQGAKLEARTREVLAQVGLKERLRHYPIQLSGGEQQRVAVARAFINRPKILFADEPTGNLDGETGKAVVRLIFDLNATHGTTLMLVTHDRDLTQQASRVIGLRGGRLVADSRNQVESAGS